MASFLAIFCEPASRKNVLAYMPPDTLCAVYIGINMIINEELHKYICYDIITLLLKYPQKLDILYLQQFINNANQMRVSVEMNAKMEWLSETLNIYQIIKFSETQLNTLMHILFQIKQQSILWPIVCSTVCSTVQRPRWIDIHGIMTDYQIRIVQNVATIASEQINYVHNIMNIRKSHTDPKELIKRIRTIVKQYGVLFIENLHPIITVSMFTTYSPTEQATYYHTLYNVLCNFFKQVRDIARKHLECTIQFVDINSILATTSSLTSHITISI